MKIYTLTKIQKLPIRLDEAWDFFSSPANLVKITPSYMSFVITSDRSEEKAFAGKIITYQMKPVLNIPMTWVTEITQVKEKEYFIDEQRFGPYSFWHHLHRFKEIEGGVEMEDILHYGLPFGIVGELVHPIYIKGKLEEVFKFRYQKLEEIFGTFQK